jgi:hypothetical protein
MQREPFFQHFKVREMENSSLRRQRGKVLKERTEGQDPLSPLELQALYEGLHIDVSAALRKSQEAKERKDDLFRTRSTIPPAAALMRG